MKLWEKNTQHTTSETEKLIEQFTAGKDRKLDELLAPYDILCNIAHAKMLAEARLLSLEEATALVEELKKIYATTQQPNASFKIKEEFEDVHSQIEAMLTETLGDTGKKIHTARSRNDQVLTDIKLFLRNEIESLVQEVLIFFNLLIQKSDEHKKDLLPGYTHLQIAMPSSFGLWFGAYAESLADDVSLLEAAYHFVNKNPLGSAAGYGSSFPIQRKITTQLLGFETMHYNSVNAQMSRGKTERIVAQSLANVADTLARFSMDVCLYLSQNFDFISFPDELTTGSSIMPHKKNPDVFELIRAYCNRLKALPNEIFLMTTNLPSGYHRDMQLLKERLFPAFQTLRSCFNIAAFMVQNIQINSNILNDEKYKYLFTVDAINELVKQGVPFRDAYKQIGMQVQNNTFKPASLEAFTTTHEGSIGNLCNEEIMKAMQKTIESFQFAKVHTALEALLR